MYVPSNFAEDRVPVLHEGKWKMSQNRPTEDRAGVIEGLSREGEPAVAELVVERNPN